MSSCKTCGRELPVFTFGRLGELCSNCRAQVPGDLSVPTSSSPQSIPVQRWPPVTSVLVGINVVVFAAMLASGVSPIKPTIAQLQAWGADWGPLSLGAQPWRILTSNYVHIGVLHIVLNLWCLWRLGALAELFLDRTTYLLLYTLTGMASSLASLWWNPLVVSAGASGAIFGMAGALIPILYLGKLPIPKAALQGTLKSLLAFAGYNLFFGAAIGGRIGNAAHLGGLVTGLALGALLAKYPTAAPTVGEWWRRGVFVGAGVVLMAAFAVVKQTNGYVVPLVRGFDASQAGNLEDAVRNLEQVIARKPDHLQALNLLGSAYYKKQDYTRAEATLEHALQLDSSEAATQYNLGITKLELGKADEAIAHLKQAIQLDPKHGDSERALGTAYQAKGMQAEAEIAFKKADELLGAEKPH